MSHVDGMEPGQVWEWTGFVDRDGVRVTLLVLEVEAGRLRGPEAVCATLDSSHESVWRSGEVGTWGLSGPDRFRRIA